MSPAIWVTRGIEVADPNPNPSPHPALHRSTLSVFTGRATIAVRKTSDTQTPAEHLLTVLYQGPSVIDRCGPCYLNKFD